MANSMILEPVAEQDPCGPDLRWDDEFLGLMDAFSVAEVDARASCVEGELVGSTARTFDEVIERAVALLRQVEGHPGSRSLRRGELAPGRLGRLRLGVGRAGCRREELAGCGRRRASACRGPRS